MKNQNCISFNISKALIKFVKLYKKASIKFSLVVFSLLQAI